jgi:hypothetical protein
MPRKVIFERTGGFIGIRQRLELAGGRLVAEDARSRLKKERDLTADERQRLEALLAGVEGQDAPTGDATGVSDGFVLNLELPDRAPIRFHTLSVPFGKGDGSPFGELFAFLDGLLGAAVDGQGRGIMQL